MSIIDSIRKFFGRRADPRIITMDQANGLFEGGAVGEALGVPVKDRTPEQLHRSPVGDILGFGDYRTPGGTLSVCTEAAYDFVDYLADNEIQGFAPLRLLALCNSWYIYKVKDEDARLRLLLPAAVVAGSLFSVLPKLNVKEAVGALPDLVCDQCIATASLFFCAGKCVSCGLSPDESVKKASDILSKVCSEIGLVVSGSGVTSSFKNVLETSFAHNTDGYSSAVLSAVNSGVYSDLTGYLVGSLAGICYNSAAIPEAWKSSVFGMDNALRHATVLHTLVNHAAYPSTKMPL